MAPPGPGDGDGDQPDGLEVDSASGFTTRTLMVLKGKTSPETRLSTEELQVARRSDPAHWMPAKTNENLPRKEICKTIC